MSSCAAVTAEGLAIVLTSDTLEETIGLSHSIVVMRDGEITYRTDADPGAKTAADRPHRAHGLGRGDGTSRDLAAVI